MTTIMKKRLEDLREIEKRNNERVEEFIKEQEEEDAPMKMIFVDVCGTQSIRTMDVPHDLHAWYDLLQCSLVEMPMREIDGQKYIFICDEEGLFHSPNRVSAIGSTGYPMLVGNLLICRETEDHDLRGLTDEEAAHILQHVKHLMLRDKNGPEVWDVISDVEFPNY